MDQKNSLWTLIVVMLLSILLTSCASEPEIGSNGNKKSKTPAKGNNSNMNVNNGAYSTNLPPDFKMPSDAVGKRMMQEYGAVFVARGGVIPPNTPVFKDENEVKEWQSKLTIATETIGEFTIQLQAPAMKALKEAISEGESKNQTITPRGEDAGRRDYAGTVELWASRVNPGLDHWVAEGRVSKEDAARIRALSPFDQVPEIFKLEDQGIYFAKDLTKSIIYSVAPPGTSQHISMLAFDVSQHENSEIRAILNRHGWFQTVVSDRPHFTYLGVDEEKLGGLGLKKISQSQRVFWVPDI